MARVRFLAFAFAVLTTTTVAHAADDPQTPQEQQAEEQKQKEKWVNPPKFGASLPPPKFPSPFVLPDLAHQHFDARLDWYLGRLAPTGEALATTNSGRTGTVAGIVRASVESSFLIPRRLYVGLQYPFALALPPDGGLAPGEVGVPSGSRVMPGNLEGHIRAVFPLPTFLEIGFSIGVVAPTSPINRRVRPNRAASDAAASLDPTNVVQFLPGRVTLRPAGDLRILRGPLVIQGRHGLDVLIDDIGIDHVKVAGRLLGHVGLLVRDNLEIAMEGSQYYYFASDDRVASTTPSADKAFAEKYRISDQRRSAMTFGPTIRVAYPEADFGVALITNAGDPLSPSAHHFLALHFSVIGHMTGLR